MRRYILHIGSKKTGTSTIQRFLHNPRNRRLLKEHDIDVAPMGPVWNGRKVTARIRNLARAPLPEAEMAAAFGELVDIDIAGGSRHVVRSDEIFQGLLARTTAHMAAMIRAVRERGLRLDVICYIRDQVSWMNSAYCMSVRHCVHDMTFDEYVADPEIRRQFGMMDLFSGLIDLAGQDGGRDGGQNGGRNGGVRLDFRPYAAARKDLTADFLAALDIPPGGDGWQTARDANLTPDPQVIEFMRRNRDRLHGLPLADLRRMVDEAMDRLARAGRAGAPFQGFSAGTAQEIRQHFRAGNLAFLDRIGRADAEDLFFPRQDRPQNLLPPGAGLDMDGIFPDAPSRPKA